MNRSTHIMLLGLLLGLLLVPGAGNCTAQTKSVPDLSGTYNSTTLTPVQRPKEFGENLYLTEEEATRLAEEERALMAKANQKSDPNRAAPEAGGSAPVGAPDDQRENLGAGNVGGYNFFWIDRGEEAMRVDGKIRTSVLTDPPNGRYPARSLQGSQRWMKRARLFRPNTGEAWWVKEQGPGPYDGPESLALSERCLLGFSMGPPMFPALYNNYKRIIQTADHVMILVEMVHDARVVRLNSEHAPADVHKWLGDSIGWFEGDTLVVDTTNFRDGDNGLGGSDQLHVVERFRRIDAGALSYSFTVEDPGTWTQSWSGDYVWPATDGKVYEYACHEGNYAMGGILRGARLLEQEALGGS